ncbi:Hypothetical membrane spanning protein [Bacillus thuringiensis serovar israelensis ATCC 35646]|nr:Hypothetical membrane spanning protein [Bacillus thuringiensis serovar israelensis ATCC 35646]
MSTYRDYDRSRCFPVLGPTVHTTMDIKIILSIFILSFLYCWIYAGFCRIMMNRLCKVLY